MPNRVLALIMLCLVVFGVLLVVAAKNLPAAVVGVIVQVGEHVGAIAHTIQAQPQYVLVLLGAFVAAMLALVFNTLLEYVKRRIAKEPLLDLIITDLGSIALDVQQNSLGISFSKGTITAQVRGVGGLHFENYAPDVIYETYNIKLYETEGFKLASTLKSDTRRKFWKVYKLMREVEATRVALAGLAKDDLNQENLQVLYSGLNKELYPKILELVNLLNDERFPIRRPFAPLT